MVAGAAVVVVAWVVVVGVGAVVVVSAAVVVVGAGDVVGAGVVVVGVGVVVVGAGVVVVGIGVEGVESVVVVDGGCVTGIHVDSGMKTYNELKLKFLCRVCYSTLNVSVGYVILNSFTSKSGSKQTNQNLHDYDYKLSALFRCHISH